MIPEENFIDIIIPTYNSEAHIRDSLESLINQNNQNWNCIIVDDGSSDGTIDICMTYAKKDNRFNIYLRSEESQKGGNSCRNIGLSKASSEYIVFFDSDDILREAFVSNRIRAIKENSDFDFLVFKTAFLETNGEIVGYFPCVEKSIEDLIFCFIKHDIQWQTMSVLWNRVFLEKIGAWNEDYERLQDVELSIRALSHRPNIVFFGIIVDSLYRMSEYNKVKMHAALYGFSRVLFDYHVKLINDRNFTLEFREDLKLYLTEAIIRIVHTYFELGKNDPAWTSFFLKKLKNINLDPEDYLQIEHIIADFNSKV